VFWILGLFLMLPMIESISLGRADGFERGLGAREREDFVL